VRTDEFQKLFPREPKEVNAALVNAFLAEPSGQERIVVAGDGKSPVGLEDSGNFCDNPLSHPVAWDMLNHLTTGNGVKALASEGQEGSVSVNEQSSLQQTQLLEPFLTPLQGFKRDVSANNKICVFGEVPQHSPSPTTHLNQIPKPFSVTKQGIDGHPDLKWRQENQTEQPVVKNCLLIASLHLRLLPKPFLLIMDVTQLWDDVPRDAIHNRKPSPTLFTS